MNLYSRNLASGLLLLLAGGHAFAADVRGTVRDELAAQPIAGASVRLFARYGDGSPRFVGATATGDDGAYRLDLPAFTGDAAIMAEAPDHAPRNQAGEACLAPADCLRSTTNVGTAPVTANFALPRGARLSGRVVDAGDGSHPGYGSLVLRSNTTGGTLETPVTTDGYFRFVGLPAGDYTLVSRARESAAGPDAYPETAWPERPCDDVAVACSSVTGDTITLDAGKEPAPLDVRVSRGAYVRTRVFSTAGGALEHSAQLHLAANPQRHLASLQNVDDDGYNYTGPVLPGAYKLLVAPWPASNYYRVVYPATTCPDYPCNFSAGTTLTLASGQLLLVGDFHVSPVPFIDEIYSDTFEQ